MNCEKTCRTITTVSFVALIAVFLFLVLGQFVIKNVFIEIFQMDNFITDMSVTGGSDGMVSVDWETLYPFEESVEENAEQEALKAENPLLSKVRSLIKVVDMYSNDYLPFKEYVKVPSGLFDRLIDNRMVDTNNIYLRTGKDGLIVRSPFYQEFSGEELDVTKLLKSVTGLRDYLDSMDIGFLYVQAPIKEDKYDEEYVNEYGLSYESQLADKLVEGLKLLGVNVMDLRTELHEQGMDCYDAFFETDNHWKTETAFWATGMIAQELNDDFGFRFDMNLFNTENYEKKVYENWVQGTIGRGVTLVNAPYDDISVFIPKFETSLNMKIPNLNMDKTGSFLETMINPVGFEKRSTVYHGAYDAFAYSKPPVTEVTNYLETQNNEKTILLLRESFAGPVITYLSLGIEKLYAVTPEGFTGSIEQYIKGVQPDMVIILYTAPTTNEVTSKYDFR